MRLKILLSQLEQKDRKVLRAIGVKFGRYHIFLFKLLKPKAVIFENFAMEKFYQKYLNLNIPKFGLNFYIMEKN